MGNAERIFSAAFGALLPGLGIFALFQDHLSFGWRPGGSCLLAAARLQLDLRCIPGESILVVAFGPTALMLKGPQPDYFLHTSAPELSLSGRSTSTTPGSFLRGDSSRLKPSAMIMARGG